MHSTFFAKKMDIDKDYFERESLRIIFFIKQMFVNKCVYWVCLFYKFSCII